MSCKLVVVTGTFCGTKCDHTLTHKNGSAQMGIFRDPKFLPRETMPMPRTAMQ